MTRVKWVPLWKVWIRPALRHLQGRRILEVSFGTGHLMAEYADRFEVHGLDLNDQMIAVARRNLLRAGVQAALCRGTVEALPYRTDAFDCVLKHDGLLGISRCEEVPRRIASCPSAGRAPRLVDINYPSDGNWFGTRLVELWKRGGDLIRDMGSLFRDCSVEYVDEEVGGCGSVHLYIATKPVGNSGPIVASDSARREE